jgi:hypothetical protein
MKNHFNIMKPTTIGKLVITLALLHVQANTIMAQEGDSTAAAVTEKPTKDKRPVKDVWESGYLINNQTSTVPTAKTLEFIIQHRFGLLTSKEFDFAGLYAPSNIRIGFNYTLSDRLQLGIGSTKNNKLQDITWKYAILRQTRSGSIPLNITYFGDAAIDVRKDIFPDITNRLSYYHELIFSRKFSKAISLQIAPSFSHFNMVDSLVKHQNIGVSFGGRVKITDAVAITFEYNQNFTAQDAIKEKDEKVIVVKPNLSIGIEAATSAHAFQVFITTGQSIISQHNMLYNSNDFSKMEFCIGFNMTRLWNY